MNKTNTTSAGMKPNVVVSGNATVKAKVATTRGLAANVLSPNVKRAARLDSKSNEEVCVEDL